jgi:hypothetical protein
MNLLQSKHPITRREKRVNDKLFPIFEASIGSKQLVGDLVALGCVPAKSKSDLFIPPMPDSIVHHFIRGYLDGDGGVRKDKKGNLSAYFVGSRTLLLSIRDILITKAGLSRVKVAHHASIYRIGYHGNTSAKLLRDYLYKEATVWLERKREMFFSADPKYRARSRK